MFDRIGLQVLLVRDFVKCAVASANGGAGGN